VQTSGSPQTTSAPNGDTLLNEFVYDGTTLWPPPGWVKTAIIPPTGVAAAGGNASATVSWTAAAGAAGYNVYVGTTPGGESNTPSSPNVTGHSTPVTGLTAGATYYFQVTAVYNGVESARSTEIQATVPPSVPGGLQGTIGASAVTLSWSASQGATGYSIYRGASSGAETQLATGALTATSYTVANLAAGSTYYFFVVAVGAGGSQSGHSNEISKTLVPAAPASPSATAGDGSVTLNWTASTGATGYDVYEGTSAGGEGSSAQMTVTGTTTATVTGLTDGTKYYFKIAAVDAGGPSAQSAEVSATPASSTMGSSSHGGGGALRWVDLLGALILLALRPARAAWQAECRIRNRRTALQ
jgi:fibronectin type 3 domain-containing protein